VANDTGNLTYMIGVGLALLVVGIITLFVMPWVGITLGVVGLVLAALYLLGFGRRAARGEQPADRRV
jgi:Flp pilus assembly protein TadB